MCIRDRPLTFNFAIAYLLPLALHPSVKFALLNNPTLFPPVHSNSSTHLFHHFLGLHLGLDSEGFYSVIAIISLTFFTPNSLQLNKLEHFCKIRKVTYVLDMT